MPPRKSSPLAGISAAMLHKELKRRQSGGKSLLRKRDKLLTKLAALNTQITELGGPGKVGRAGANGSAARPTRTRPKNEMTLPDAITKALGSKSMTIPELTEAVKKLGYTSNSPNFRSILAQVPINNKSRFKRVERGLYAAK